MIDALPWKEPKTLSPLLKKFVPSGTFRSAMIVGDPEFGAVRIPSTDVLVGFMHLAPGVAYPAHAHDAAEFFEVLTGTGQWGVGGQPAAASSVESSGSSERPPDLPQRPRAPAAGQPKGGDGASTRGIGDAFIFHAPGVAHNLTTAAEPVFALYAWTGAIAGRYWFCGTKEDPAVAEGGGGAQDEAKGKKDEDDDAEGSGGAQDEAKGKKDEDDDAEGGGGDSDGNDASRGGISPEEYAARLKDGSVAGLNAEEYYDDMASKDDYEKTVRAWGYKMPEVVSDMFHAAASAGSSSSSSRSSGGGGGGGGGGRDRPAPRLVLDFGCGDGLVGVALARFAVDAGKEKEEDDEKGGRCSCYEVTGVDVSGKMLERAAARGCYKELRKVAATDGGEVEATQESSTSTSSTSSQLPAMFAPDTFDALTCVGTTSYLDPSIWTDWLGVVKPGGLLAMTHKTACWEAWEAHQDGLVVAGRIEEVQVSEELLYLPGFDDNARDNERVKVYVYRRKS
eukprot:g4046.t1